jgi:7-cyano-7-deazaguanine synthase
MDRTQLEDCLETASQQNSVAVLVGGGIDSTILLALLAEHTTAKQTKIYPVFVSFGLAWESAEISYLKNFVAKLKSTTLKEITILKQPMDDIYGKHWSVTGEAVPDRNSEDSAVELPGRNVLLLAKTAVWCSTRNINTIALGILAGNPFSDATIEFFDHLEASLSLALDRSFVILRPFANLKKQEVVKLGEKYPLAFTFSCINPAKSESGETVHCGACNKCEERRRGFISAGIIDPTRYVQSEKGKASVCLN